MAPIPNEISITRLSARTFARFAQFITEELGIKMPETKLPMIQSRLLRRVRELGFESVESYIDYFFHSPEADAERTHLIDVVTTNKTDLFREPTHFDCLSRIALPRFMAASRSLHLKLWCAGCSSGEEPYTLAMVLSEFGAQNPGFDFSILATDVSTRVLERARTGIYDQPLIAPVPAVMRPKYLLRGREDGQQLVRVIPELRGKISFHHLNFMDADYEIRDTFDAIFFRNVMIYFAKPTQEAVIHKICRNLAAGGYLFVGHSESLAGLDVPVRLVHASILRKHEVRP
jgi:chemotaxis protein methyltransferase CheR